MILTGANIDSLLDGYGKEVGLGSLAIHSQNSLDDFEEIMNRGYIKDPGNNDFSTTNHMTAKSSSLGDLLCDLGDDFGFVNNNNANNNVNNKDIFATNNNFTSNITPAFSNATNNNILLDDNIPNNNATNDDFLNFFQNQQQPSKQNNKNKKVRPYFFLLVFYQFIIFNHSSYQSILLLFEVI